MTAMVALRDALSDELISVARQDDRIVVLDADLATSTKVNNFQKAFPARFLQMGVAEQNMMGTAAGLATMGFMPFTSSFAVFIAKRALDQIRVSIAQPRLNVKLIGAYTGMFTGKTGKTHQTVQDIAIMRSMPNMRIVAPCDAVDMKAALKAVVEYDGPVYIRVPRDPSPVFMPEDYKFRWGRPHILRNGGDLTIISSGVFTAKAMKIAGKLQEDGVNSRVVHLPSIKPIDEKSVVEIAEVSKLIVTIEDHSVFGGLGGAIAEILSENRPTLMKRIGINDTFCESGSNEDLICKYGFAVDEISAICKSILSSL